MLNLPKTPAALTVAGSDSGGGAGIQADLKTFAALNVHGTCAITCVTAQNLEGVTGIEACSPKLVEQQMKAVFDGFHPAAAKTGMLFSAPIIRTVAKVFQRERIQNLVIDPVMIATSGAALLKPDALRVLVEKLFPLATLLTPNLDEAEFLTGVKLKSVEDLRDAAKWLHQKTGVSILLKGGHLKDSKDAVDILRIGSEEWLLSSPYIRGVRTHGTGCTYSAAITANLAHGLGLQQSIFNAKEFISNAIASSHSVSGNPVLNPFWNKV